MIAIWDVYPLEAKVIVLNIFYYLLGQDSYRLFLFLVIR